MFHYVLPICKAFEVTDDALTIIHVCSCMHIYIIIFIQNVFIVLIMTSH